jgi:adenosylcobinamide-GDP ribazoletransferase
MLTALRGAIGFLTRIPVGGGRGSWDAFRRTPAVFPLVGYLVGVVLAVPLVVGLPAPVAAFLFPVVVYLVTGITHVDGLADLGDALVVHGDADRRTEVMRDTTVGVGAVLAVVLAVAGLALAALALASGGLAVVGIVVGTEVGAKFGMAALACLGSATHEGLAAQVTGELRRRDLLVPGLLVVPAALLPGDAADGPLVETAVGAVGWPSPAVVAAVAGTLVGTALVWTWASRALGGVSGDVLGATNEIARLCGLHAGVVVWTLW